MAMFRGIRLSGFLPGREAAQFEEEMAGFPPSLSEVIRRGWARAHATGMHILSVLGIDYTPRTDRGHEAPKEILNAWQDARGEDTARRHRAMETLLRWEFARRGRRNRLRRQAQAIGLAYWPALVWNAAQGVDGTRVDPAAFVAAERVLRKQHGLWGETLPDGSTGRGGWDSQGHYGLAPGWVARIWRISGCKDSPKFRALIARAGRAPEGQKAPNLHEEPRDPPGIARRDSLARVRAFSRGYAWAERNRLSSRFSKRAYMALGRIAPWARWAATAQIRAGVVPEKERVGLMDLDWSEVARLQGQPAWKRAIHCPPRLQWQMVLGLDLPKGLDPKTPPTGWKVGVYKELCRMARIDPFGGDEALGNLQRPSLALTRLFGSVGEVSRWAAQVRGQPLDAAVLHNLGQFQLPPFDCRWDAAAWRRLVFKHPEVLEHGGRFAAIQTLTGGVPATLVQVRAAAARITYEGVDRPEDQAVAEAAAQVGLGPHDFVRYRDLMREDGKAWEEIPGFVVFGGEVGLAGEWVLRRLHARDPIGPMLGLLTNCCQHLQGAARECAISGVRDPDTAFAVVEYRGKIVAQSWLWRADDDATVVVDSIEALDSAYVEGIAALYREAAQRLVGRLGITRVLFGETDFGITADVKAALRGSSLPTWVRPKREGYRDGSTQWELPEAAS